jgi:uncharacterized protein involved in oxidation of intracellular sulfur
MKVLFIINDSPHGNQRAYNGLRLAVAMAKAHDVHVFLLGDGVICGLAGLVPAHADYNPQEMLTQLCAQGAQIGACKTCMEARGMAEESLIPAVRRKVMDDLVAWTEEVDKVIAF